MNLVGLLRDRDGLLNRLALLVLRRDRNRLRNGLKVVDSTARIVGGGARDRDGGLFTNRCADLGGLGNLLDRNAELLALNVRKG